MISVLIVDDSAFMRKALSLMLESDPSVRVVDTASNGQEAIEKVKHHRPDVVTMDIEMPVMDGLTALRHIMRDMPCPVIMISSLTHEGAQSTLEALQIGAVDFIPKQLSYVSLEISKIKDELLAKIKAITAARRRRLSSAKDRAAVAKAQPRPSLSAPGTQLLAIGVSTGGPTALRQLIPRLPANFPVPVVVTQHMPPYFTKSLADRLNKNSPLTVQEATPGTVVAPGTVLIAPGGRHLVFRRSGTQVIVDTPETPASLHRPSVDVMFTSAVSVYGSRVLAAVMTGMGYDGREGARTVKQKGGRVLAQDQASCVVYGMPKAVVQANLADAVVSLEDMADVIIRACGGPVSSVA